MIQIELQQIIDQLKTISLAEAVELVQQIEQTFGVDTTLPNPSTGSVTFNQTDESVNQTEQTEFNVSLETIPGEDQKSKRLSIFRLIRELTSVGLKEAKEMTSNLPQLIKESISKEQALEIKNQFEEIGAQIKIS
uniref:Large ribosomal subunit protein bL12c n=1 Tax=Derbesia sp. WEST4838 TaxID=1847751 RepID=A0A1C9JBC5_9CHLO|nr:ribosomal protein L12 [Derbesia sp. WEST4838]AOP19147.1 ribosomal protein L12 [Derbesia sp. WEST4838]